MSLRNSIFFSLVLVFSLSALAAGQDLVGVKCVVSGDEQAVADLSVDYKEGKVYFCCEDCLAKFQAAMKQDDNPYAVKANHQLVLTGQYEQKRCPMSGGELDANIAAQVGGTKIGFCCEHCQSKVEAADGLAAKAELVFSNAAFAKGFTVKKPELKLAGVKCMMMPQKAVNEKFSVDYLGHKVFFCCNRCKAKYSKDPESYTARANHQLVATGQVAQLACPFSGQPVSEEESSEVAGVLVKYCCEHCKSKVAQAEADGQLEMVFGASGFKKGFTKNEN